MSFIKDFMKSLDNTTLSGTAALDEAVKASSHYHYNSLQDVIDNLIADCRRSGSPEYFLKEFCGIDLTNEDTGAITGSDAGGSTVKNASDVVPESGSVDTNFNDDSFEINGLIFKIGDLSTLETTDTSKAPASSLNEKQLYIWQALHSWWAKSSLDLNAQSYGDNFSFTNQSSATVKEIYVYFDNQENSSSFAFVRPNYYPATNQTYALKLVINMNFADKITEGDPDGKFDAKGGTTYFDRTLAHEFTHAVMSANLPADTYNTLPLFVREGIAELTCGIDDEKRESIEELANDPSLINTYLSNNSPHPIYDDGDEYGKPYAAGYILFRYLNKQVANNSASGGDTPSSEVVDTGTTVTPSTETTITPTNNGETDIDEIFNGSTDEKNSYVYNSGNVTISNYESWENVVFNGTYQNLAMDGNDFVVNAAEGSVRISDARGKLMEFVDNNNNALLHVCMQKDDDTFDGTTYHESLLVIGANNEDNTIFAGDGGSTLWGGAGKNSDDILFGGDGTDIFVYNYGEGNDAIFADEEDIVNLGNVNFAQIRGLDMKDNRTLFVFDDFSSLNVMGRAGAFIIEGKTYAADYDNKQFKAVSDT